MSLQGEHSTEVDRLREAHGETLLREIREALNSEPFRSLPLTMTELHYREREEIRRRAFVRRQRDG